MKKPTTINGYLSLLKMIQSISISDLKGFDKLPIEKQEDLIQIAADTDNILNEWN